MEMATNPNRRESIARRPRKCSLRFRIGSSRTVPIKLVSFLLFRIVKLGDDKRLTDLFLSASGTVGSWIFSLLWGLLCFLPHTLGSASSAPGSLFATLLGFGVRSVFGWFDN